MIYEKLQLFMMDQDEESRLTHKKKDSFWCTESEAPVFDLYHKWIGTPPTNPVNAEKLIVFSAGKMMELALVENLIKAGMVKKLEDNKQLHISIERCGVPISGYVDAILVDGEIPLEVKSFYGDYQSRELQSGIAKTSYLKQLAMYMDAMCKDKGILLYMDRGTGEMYEFVLHREGNIFKCNNIEFNIEDTYKRWSKLYANNILKGIEPSPFTDVGKYKEDIDLIDWKQISNSDISKARMGHKVIGGNKEHGWKILYSPYKDLIIERQGCTPGYCEEEIEKIKRLTKGYSTKK